MYLHYGGEGKYFSVSCRITQDLNVQIAHEKLKKNGILVSSGTLEWHDLMLPTSGMDPSYYGDQLGWYSVFMVGHWF